MSANIIINWALQTGLAISILILFILVVRKPVARLLGAKTAYALWALPVLRLFMPAIPILAPKTVPPLSNNFDGVLFVGPAENVQAAEMAAGSSANWPMISLSIWLIGMLVWLTYQLCRQHTYRMSVDANSKVVSNQLEIRAQTVARRLGTNWLPEVRQSTEDEGPLVTGLFYPVIILPRGFEQNYSTDQQDLTLAHELSHIQRRDLWASVAALVFRAVNWPNPLVHWAAQAFRSDQEAACDQTVLTRLGNDHTIARIYAQTLIHAAKLAGNTSRPVPLGLTIFTPLKERLMILKTTQKRSMPLRAAASVLAIGALMATAPFTASAGPDGEAHNVEKKVMKWVTKEDGVETKRHIEITTENGVTTAYEIDDLGNRTVVDLDTIDMPDMPHAPGEHKRVMIKKMGDGGEMDVEIKELLGDVDIEEYISGEDGEHKVVIKRMHGDGHVMAFSDSEDFEFHTVGGGKANLMVGVAADMLENIDTSDMDRRTRKKVEEAQKALREAKEALAQE